MEVNKCGSGNKKRSDPFLSSYVKDLKVVTYSYEHWARSWSWFLGSQPTDIQERNIL